MRLAVWTGRECANQRTTRRRTTPKTAMPMMRGRRGLERRRAEAGATPGISGISALKREGEELSIIYKLNQTTEQ